MQSKFLRPPSRWWLVFIPIDMNFLCERSVPSYGYGTPGRSGSVSPSRRSSARKLSNNLSSSFSQLMRSIDYENISVIDSIPEREWKLLSALSRKREDDRERERLVDQFHKMWQKEKEDREMHEAEINNEYNTYLHRKRQQDRYLYEHMRRQRAVEQQLRRHELMESIQNKEARWRDQLANMDDIKATKILNKAIDEECKTINAAYRRCRQMTFEELRRKTELEAAKSKEKEALTRRNAKLREAAQRLAISNELSTWETIMHRQELEAMNAAKRASHAAHAALTSERSDYIARERDEKKARARRIAQHTWQMREDLKAGLFKLNTNRTY